MTNTALNNTNIEPIWAQIFDLYKPGESFSAARLLPKTQGLDGLSRTQKLERLEQEIESLCQQHCDENPLLIRLTKTFVKVA